MNETAQKVFFFIVIVAVILIRVAALRKPKYRIAFVSDSKLIQPRGNEVMRIDQTRTLTAVVVDKAGNVIKDATGAPVKPSNVTWKNGDDSLASLVQNTTTPEVAQLTPVGKLGVDSIAVTGIFADTTINGSYSEEFTAGQPAGLAVAAGDPVDAAS